MRKKILGIAVMAVVAVAAAWNINQSENEIKLSDLALDNVEALASGEGGSGYCSYSGGGCIIKYSDGTSTYMYNPQNEMFRLLGTKRSFSQNETFFFSHP